MKAGENVSEKEEAGQGMKTKKESVDPPRCGTRIEKSEARERWSKPRERGSRPEDGGQGREGVKAGERVKAAGKGSRSIGRGSRPRGRGQSRGREVKAEGEGGSRPRGRGSRLRRLQEAGRVKATSKVL